MKRLIVLVILLLASMLSSCASLDVPSAWAPALEDPNGPLLVKMALVEFTREFTGFKTIRIIPSLLPGGTAPVCKGIHFVPVESPRDLPGVDSGEVGIRFIEFKKRNLNVYTVRLGSTLRLYLNSHPPVHYAGGGDHTYFFVKTRDGWGRSVPCNY
jgi:hypothetical protein